jgi:hypothetical protein
MGVNFKTSCGENLWVIFFFLLCVPAPLRANLSGAWPTAEVLPQRRCGAEKQPVMNMEIRNSGMESDQD